MKIQSPHSARVCHLPRSLFHNLLVPPLDGALPLIQPQSITMFISQHLQQAHRAPWLPLVNERWFVIYSLRHKSPLLISSVIIETIYPNHTLQNNIAFTWQTSGSGILQRIPLTLFVCMWVLPVSLYVWGCLWTSQWAVCRLQNWMPLLGMRIGNLPCNSEHAHKVAAVIKAAYTKITSYNMQWSIVIAKCKSRSQ